MIGAPVYTIYQTHGSVYLYKYINGKYELCHEFFPLDGRDYQYFGSSVLIKGNLLIIGSLSDSTESGIYSGSIYVYTKEDSLWEFSKKYLPKPNSENLAYGCAIASNDNFIFIGTTDNVNYFNPGKVYM